MTHSFLKLFDIPIKKNPKEIPDKHLYKDFKEIKTEPKTR